MKKINTFINDEKFLMNRSVKIEQHNVSKHLNLIIIMNYSFFFKLMTRD